VELLLPNLCRCGEEGASRGLPLKALVRHLDQPLLVVWDLLPAHRSRLVQDYLASLQGWIATAYLPPYAPELNPVEYIWGYWKQHDTECLSPGLLAAE
jgi:transposase